MQLIVKMHYRLFVKLCQQLQQQSKSWCSVFIHGLDVQYNWSTSARVVKCTCTVTWTISARLDKCTCTVIFSTCTREQQWYICKYDISQSLIIILTMSTVGPLNGMHCPEVMSSADQCDPLAAPLLKKFPKLLSKVKIVYDCHYDLIQKTVTCRRRMIWIHHFRLHKMIQQ